MKILDIALSQEGTPETGLNNILYNTWYYGHPVSGGSYPYCAVFVSWCAEQAGLSTDIIPKTASVISLYNFFLEKKQFKRKNEYIPQAGDIMIQRSNGASHTGIVIMSDGQGFYTIEGNAGIGVEKCWHSYYDQNLTGFGTPNYPVEVVTKFTAAAPPVKAINRTANLMAASNTTTETSVAPIATITSPQMTETEIWDWFRAHGYNAEATAGIMGRMKCESAGYSPYYETIREWNGVEVGGMGMFQWTWDVGDKIDTIPPTGDLATGRQKYPNSRLAKYLNWCDQNNKEYEACLSQLDYLWEVDLDENAYFAQYYCGMSSWRPDEMNKLTVEQAAKNWTKGYERGQVSSEVSEAQKLYNMYKDRPVTNQISSTGKETGMRTNTVAANVVGVGRYTYVQYSVGEGDTLESIAEKYNVTPQMILFANDLNEWKVTAGQTIYVPQASQILSKTDAQEGVEALATLTHSMNISVSHPTVEVHFYGEYGKLAAKSTLSADRNDYMDYDIISVSTSRNMGQDCPTFTISLVRRNDWYDNLASNDLVVIFMQRPPEESHVVMFGLIDDIRRSMDWSSGQPQASVQVTGRGFNKAFCHFDIGMLENYSSLDMFTGFFAAFNNLVTHGSAEAIQLVVESYIDKGMKYKFGDGKTLKDYFVYQGTKLEGEKLLDTKSFTSFNGSMWNFIKELGNTPFNETYWEVINDSPTMVHRPTPFEKENWIKLNRITIKDYDLVANNTGRSDLETYTVFNVHMSLMGESTHNLIPPLWYPPFYSKYGLREHKVKTIYEIQGMNYNPIKFTMKLFNFYIKNNISENGQLTVKGSNQYKVGERVILESEDMEYYVEGVSHNFNMYSNWTTSLQVTRGLHPAERFTPPYGAAEDLTPTIMNAIIKMTSTGHIDWYDLPEQTFGTVNADGTYSNSSGVGSGNSMVGADGDWFSYKGLTWTHPAPECKIITSPFGPRNTGIPGASTYHKGIDLACEGDAAGRPIIAAADGTVEYAGPASGYGNCIDINHGSGLLTRYAHMYSDGILVSEGQKVAAGQHIANIGAAGVGSGAHLHFELREGGAYGNAINPEEIFQVRGQAPASVLSPQTGANSNDPYNTISVNASAEEVATACYQYLMQRGGFNKCATCAVLGNIQQESAFDLNITNSIGAFGLCQWLGSRKSNLFSFCANNGLEVNSVAGQMGYLLHELSTTETGGKSVLNGANNSRDSVYTTAVSFGEAFERYGKGEEGGRGTYAVQWWDYFG